MMSRDEFYKLPPEYQNSVKRFAGEHFKLYQPGRRLVLTGLGATTLTVAEATINFVTEKAIPTSFVEGTAAIAALLLTSGIFRWAISNRQVRRATTKNGMLS